MPLSSRGARRHVVLTAALCVAAARGARAQPTGTAAAGRSAVARGVTFTVDTTPDRLVPNSDSAAARLFTGFTAIVTAVAGRGRVDILAVSATPASVAGLPITGPTARLGDYYLFDSTGVVLVRPRERTYARLTFRDFGVGGPDDRTGWPSEMWEITPIRVATLPARAAAGPGARDVTLFWHLDLNQRTPNFRELARGRLRAAQLPLGDVGVVRWFGPAQALARLPNLGVALAAPQIGVTAVAPVPAAAGSGGVNFIMQRSLGGLRAVDVDTTRLMLPRGYTEQAWPTEGASRK